VTLRLAILAAAFAAAAVSGCSVPRGAPADNPRLRELYEQDQADRRGTATLSPDVDRRDAERRRAVRFLLDAAQVRTAADHYHAAMIFQHGSDSTDHRLAHELAARAEAMGSEPARWLAAASLDRWLLSTGQPQRYGTQFVEAGGRTYLAVIDTLAVTDAERRRAGVETLDGIRARLARVNGMDEGSLAPPPAAEERHGPTVELVGTVEELARQVRYPEAARAAGISGTVRVQLVVQPDGTVAEAFVVDGLGDGLDEEVLRVVRLARFTNPTGEPHEIRLRIPVSP
jgi:TonB family protein